MPHSATRYETYFRLATEGIWCFALEDPVPVTAPLEEQVAHIMTHGTLVECNDAMARMYGLDHAGELIGARLGDLLVPTDERNVAMIRDFVTSGYRMIDRESVELGQDGKPRSFLNNFIGSIIGGYLVEAWGTQRDITAMKRLEAELRASQKLELIGRLAGGIAHDFRNLLMVVQSNATVMRMDLPDGDPRHEDLEVIEQAAERGVHLTRQLLAESRHAASHPRAVDVSAIASQVAALFRRVMPPQIVLSIEAPVPVGTVWADPGQLEQVLMNLIVNAQDAMPDGGKIRIRIEEALRASVPQIAIAVTDTGCGMTAEVQERLFEAFFTTKGEKGTGLGLSTSLGIVTEHRGEIAIDSELGRGTTMTIYLPRHEAVLATAAAAAPA